MRKNEPTVGDYKAGRLTSKQKAEFEKIINKTSTIFDHFNRPNSLFNKTRAWIEEATILFEAINNQGISKALTYVESHPPSPGAVVMLAAVLDRLIQSENGKRAQKGKDDKWEPVRQFAFDLANEKQYHSVRQAALNVQDRVIERAHKIGIKISKSQAETTITGWLREKGYTPPARKRSTSTR